MGKRVAYVSPVDRLTPARHTDTAGTSESAGACEWERSILSTASNA